MAAAAAAAATATTVAAVAAPSDHEAPRRASLRTATLAHGLRFVCNERGSHCATETFAAGASVADIADDAHATLTAQLRSHRRSLCTQVPCDVEPGALADAQDFIVHLIARFYGADEHRICTACAILRNYVRMVAWRDLKYGLIEHPGQRVAMDSDDDDDDDDDHGLLRHQTHVRSALLQGVAAQAPAAAALHGSPEGGVHTRASQAGCEVPFFGVGVRVKADATAGVSAAARTGNYKALLRAARRDEGDARTLVLSGLCAVRLATVVDEEDVSLFVLEVMLNAVPPHIGAAAWWDPRRFGTVDTLFADLLRRALGASSNAAAVRAALARYRDLVARYALFSSPAAAHVSDMYNCLDQVAWAHNGIRGLPAPLSAQQRRRAATLRHALRLLLCLLQADATLMGAPLLGAAALTHTLAALEIFMVAQARGDRSASRKRRRRPSDRPPPSVGDVAVVAACARALGSVYELRAVPCETLCLAVRKCIVVASVRLCRGLAHAAGGGEAASNAWRAMRARDGPGTRVVEAFAASVCADLPAGM
jgi:hypothetical protein